MTEVAAPDSRAATSSYGRQEPSTERVQYTIKGVDAQVIEQMRAAAKAQGMKMNAWISDCIREGAKRSNPETDHHERSAALSDLSALREKIERIESHQRYTSDSLAEIRAALQRVVDAQHGVLALVARKPLTSSD